MYKHSLLKIVLIQFFIICIIVTYGFAMLLNKSGGTDIGAAGVFLMGLGGLNLMNLIATFKSKSNEFFNKEFLVLVYIFILSIATLFIGNLIYKAQNVI